MIEWINSNDIYIMFGVLTLLVGFNIFTVGKVIKAQHDMTKIIKVILDREVEREDHWNVA